MPRFFSEKKRGLLTKTLLTMKLTAILLLTTTLQVGARAVAQRVSLSLKNAPIEKAFLEIKRQTGYSFVYGAVILKKANPVSVECKNASLEQALALCFSNQPLAFTIIDKTVAVKVKEPVITDATDTAGKSAPPGQVRGVVLSENGPLKGASVTSRKTHRGTSTDERGDFMLAGIPDADTLAVSYIGYTVQEIPAKQNSNGIVYVVLKVAVDALDQAEVIAYGTATRRYTVGSIATVSSKDIEMQPVTNPLDALAGRVAGLQVTSTSGAPGAMVLTQIRGQNTLSDLSFGNLSAGKPYVPLSVFDQPLYVIDGVPFASQNTSLNAVLGALSSLSAGPSSTTYNNPYGGISPLNSINPLDIESITVLKDADATAVYGSRGGHGVILINTKKAKAGKSTMNVSIRTGPTTAARHVDMMNTAQYLQMRHEALKNDGLVPSIAPGRTDYDLLLFDTTKNTNWYKELLGKTAQNTDVHIGMSGGSGPLSYNIGAGYTRSTFNYPGNFADQRYSLNSNFTMRSANNRLTLSIGSMITYDDNQNSSGVNSFGLINLAPNFPAMLDSAGNLLWLYKGYSLNTLSGNKSPNYYAGLRQPSRLQDYLLNQNLRFSYSVLKDLSFDGTLGYSRLQSDGYSASPIASQQPSSGTIYGTAKFQTITSESFNIDPQLTYNHTFGRARVIVSVGGTYQKNVQALEVITGNNYTNDALLNSLAGASVVSASSSNIVDKYVAGFGRANLVWNSRYIVNLTGNINGSSLFGPGRRFGNFGSAGAGWIFSETKWVKQVTPWLSFGKIAANFGLTGSNGVQPYQYQPNWGASGAGTTYQGSMVYNPLNLSSPDFHWSTKHDYNGSLSLGLFHDWLLIELGGYLSWTGDQLLTSPLPSQAGFSSVTANAPYTVQNKGWEITISPGHTNLTGGNSKKFTWFAPAFNMSRNYNEITRVDPNSTFAAFFRKGYSTSATALVKYVGVDPATGLFQFLKADGKTLTNTPFPISAFYSKLGDANQMVDLLPAINFGFGDGFSWKGFKVNFHGLFTKQKGFSYLSSVYNASIGTPGIPSVNQPALILGKEWQKPGDNATLQRFSSTLANTAFPYSTAAIVDASYLRIDNLNISYQFPNQWIRRLGMTSCLINISCRNLLTITPYQVGDPATQNIYSIPPQRVFNGGVNLTF